MLSSHTVNSPDPYLRPQFSVQNKVRRVVWSIAWVLLCRWTPKPMHAWRIWVLRRFGARIGAKSFVYPSCKVWAPWLLETEEVITIGPDVEVYNPGGVFLGHHSILSQGAFLCGATHDYNSAAFTYLSRAIVLEPYAWVCARAVVLPGVHCREGSVLGAAALTSRDLEPWTVYAGNPAKPVKERHNFTVKTSLTE